jgi:Helix-turn-helix domain
MAFTNVRDSQLVFLYNYLRGTGRSLTARQAENTFGIRNLSARMSEFRSAGLRVRTNEKTQDGRTKYAVSSRDVFGSRASFLA